MLRDHSTESIKEWVLREEEARVLNGEEVDHVVRCLKKIADWYTKEIPPYMVGDFLRAVLLDSFSRVTRRADNINGKILHIYTKFLYNNIGSDWRERAQEDFGKIT